MKITMKLRILAGAALVGLLLGAAESVLAAGEKGQNLELEQARQEVERAREELNRATRELARSMGRLDKDNPRAKFYEYMTNPKRAVLGVIIDDEANKDDRGVHILAITPGGGAEKAGLKAGDVLLSLNGESLAAKGDQRPEHRLRDVLGKLEAGAELKAEYERDGKRSKTKIKTQAPEDDMAMGMIPPLPPGAMLEMDEEDFVPMPMMSFSRMFRGSAIRGLELCKIDDDLAGYFKTKDGVLVIKAPRDATLGIKSGDVIQKIDGDPVSEPVTVMDKLRSRNDEQLVKIEVLRQGKKLTLNAKIPVAAASDSGMHKEFKFVFRHDDKDHDQGGDR